MSRRNILVASYHFPTGIDPAEVKLFWTLVNAAHKAVDGYRQDDNKGVVGTFEITVNNDEHVVPLTPTTEILGETEWKLVIKFNRKTIRTIYTTLAAGADLTLPEFIALDPAPGYWDVVENRLLPNPTGSVDGSIATIVGEEWVVGGAPAGSGTVTSVAVTGASGITVSGSPITSAGTIALGLDLGSIPAGDTGPAGDSAYEIAVADGFVGDETAWLASLVGADGATGPAGDPGPAGPSEVSTDAGQVLSLGADSLIYYGGGTGGHDPLTVTDGTTVNLTLAGQDLTAEVIPGAIDATALSNGPVEAGATADQTGAEVEGLLDAELANTDWKKPVGTIAGTVAAGDDSRLSNARAPTAHAAAHALGGADALSAVIAPRTTVTIVSGAASFPLNNSAYTCQLSEDLTSPTFLLPVGGDASANEFGCRIDFEAPVSGTFVFPIPQTPTPWKQLGPLDAITLSAGDPEIVVIVATFADGTIGYTAQQVAA